MIKSILTAVAVVWPATATADFVPTLDEKPSVCPDRPERPDLIGSDPKDAHKGILLQKMYSAKSMQMVAESGDCSCETRFPEWAETIEYYQEHYSNLEYWPTNNTASEYDDKAREYRKVAKPICKKAGNW